MMMPRQKPGQSKQDYRTPENFLKALKERLGIKEFDIDLAADKDNAVAPRFYDEEIDSLTQKWKVGDGWAFCNPPYHNLSFWTHKAMIESLAFYAKIAMLVPASVGSNWWRDSVNGKAYVLFLNGRITFVGCEDPYPKDCAVLIYEPFLRGGYSVWTWDQGED